MSAYAPQRLPRERIDHDDDKNVTSDSKMPPFFPTSIKREQQKCRNSADAINAVSCKRSMVLDVSRYAVRILVA